MPDSPSPMKRRFSYAEWRDTFEDLEEIAAEKRLDVCDIIRQATMEFVARCRASEAAGPGERRAKTRRAARRKM